jgi:CheY-like chemotaxis protein
MSSVLKTNDAASNAAEYLTRCHSCNTAFDAMSARWCDCLVPLRTLRCPHCDRCFCRTPLPFKRRFWTSAPRQLQQDPNRFLVQLSGAPAAAAAARPSPSSSARRPLVMIVDDDESMKSLVACFVDQLGYRVITASDPIDALNLMSVRDVDLVITDALMPRMDGREMCRRIKSAPEGAGKKVIVMTSLYKSRAFRSEALSAFGADELIAKPLNFTALADLLDRFAPIAR